MEIKTAVDAARDAGQTALPAETLTGFARRYDAVVEAGYTVNPRPPPVVEGKQRGRPAQTPPLNLLDRLRDFKAETLAHSPHVTLPTRWQIHGTRVGYVGSYVKTYQELVLKPVTPRHNHLLSRQKTATVQTVAVYRRQPPGREGEVVI